MPITTRLSVLLISSIVALNAFALTPEAIKAATQIDEARIVHADSEPGNWLAHGRTYDEQRYSPLTQINAGNVQQLGLAWYFDTDYNRGLESTPIVVDGVMYSTGNWSIVYANDARTGALLWKFDPEVPREWAVHVCCDVVNRGVAVWKGRVYVGTLDGRLIAVDAATGAKVWDKLTIDPKWPYTITGAPRIIKDKVMIGNAGAEYGVRGYVSAYDTETGDMAWRFYTVPGNPADGFEDAVQERIAKTWSGEWWKGGGGGTVWDSMAYDPELNLLYIGVGNGGPWNRYLRNPEGKDNLFVGSIVALNPDTGAYVWHYQATPNDGWDFTSTQHMILADLQWQGKQRKVLMQAPKNGFFFVLDRATGEFLSAVPYARVNWALGYDAQGRPIENPKVDYRDGSKIVRPSSMGAHNWHPMSYSPKTGLVYIPVIDALYQYSPDASFKRKPGFWNLGMKPIEVAPAEDLFNEQVSRSVTSGALLAWDPVQQREVWRVQHPMVWNGGVLSTASNLVFQGTADGRFVAYGAEKGEKLWEFKTETGVIASPVTYTVDGEQYVAVQAGWGGGFGLAAGLKPEGVPAHSRMLVFKLGATNVSLPPSPKPVENAPPPRTTASKETIKHGEELFHAYCFGCHGMAAVSNGALPDLRFMHESRHKAFQAIVRGGALKSLGMVSFADVVTEQDAEDIHAYVIERGNQAIEQRAQAPWWVDIKTKVYKFIGGLMAKYL